MTSTNLNPICQSIAARLPVTLGSPLWLSAGMGLRPADTGAHGAYGHSWAHLWSTEWCYAALSNVLVRPVFHPGETHRDASYEYAGRPSWWKNTEPPVIAQDGSKTGAVWIGDKCVWGDESSHFQVGPLCTVIDKGQSVMVEIPWEGHWMPVPASAVARVLLRMKIGQLAGAFRTHGDYHLPDRPVANMLRAVSAALDREILNPAVPQDAADRDVFLAYLDQWLERELAPRVFNENNKGHSQSWTTNLPVPNPDIARQWYNGPLWLVPALYDVQKHLIGKRKQDTVKALWSLCWLVWHLNKLDGLGCGGISYPDSQVGKPNNDYSWLTAANVHKAPDDYTYWTPRALDIAGKVLGEPALSTRAKEIAAANPGTKQWNVNAAGHYFAPVEPKL